MSESEGPLGRRDFGYFVSYSAVGFNLTNMFDPVINAYLVQHCGQNPQTSPVIGVPNLLSCRLLGFLGFPNVFDFGLRVTELGDSSVTYEIGIFELDAENPSALGVCVHDFVESQSRMRALMNTETREGLSRLLVG
ncbi:hypothetical protein VKT23_013736 [Stygiomarasmius scandens]|uniref:Uncharacterized protein n=1 Tax=Marasmiellus scandens TaxID=2682957 RepID=A0ABR1J2C1_9AGAR